MNTYKVIVEFTVLAEPIGPWSVEQSAESFVSHRIDEGYRMEEHIKDWRFLATRQADEGQDAFLDEERRY